MATFSVVVLRTKVGERTGWIHDERPTLVVQARAEPDAREKLRAWSRAEGAVEDSAVLTVSNAGETLHGPDRWGGTSGN